jgi:adenosylcobinamide-GDP ribazoletransferase
MPDFLRLVIGTLTRLPVPSPRRIDGNTARWAMAVAPAIGFLLGGIAVVALDGVRVLAKNDHSPSLIDLLAATVAIAALAFMSRGLHLDGLADTFDGLGVKGAPDEATRMRRLAVMRSPEIGAFGVISIVLCVLIQVTALAACVAAGLGSFGLLTAAMSSRLAITLSCRPSVPSARPDGLGATVAGSVPVPLAGVVSIVVIGAAALFGRLDDDASLRTVIALVGSVLAAILVSQLSLRIFTRAFGGVTGDVLGAVTEISVATSLLTTAFLF